jgi:hypothetical protein
VTLAGRVVIHAKVWIWISLPRTVKFGVLDMVPSGLTVCFNDLLRNLLLFLLPMTMSELRTKKPGRL